AVPVIIAMPDGHVIERRGNANEQARISAREAFEKDLLESVLPLVESSYRVQADRDHRAVAGLSMGGGQSLAVGLNHPDRFAWVGAFSAAAPANDPSAKDSVIAGLRAHPERANELKLLWIAIGKDDFLTSRNREFDKTLTELKIKHEYLETPGNHRWGV